MNRHRASFYPTPEWEVPHDEIVEILVGYDVVINDAVSRHHPEVPLTSAERDDALAALGYRRIGPWTEFPDDRAEAPVVPAEKGV